MVDVINELTNLTHVSKQGLKMMKIIILRALGAQGGYLELDAGGKPSTWFPPGRLVEHIYFN